MNERIERQVAAQRDGARSDEPAVHPAVGDRRAVGAVRQLGSSDAFGPVSDAASAPVIAGSALGAGAPAPATPKNVPHRGGATNPSATRSRAQFAGAVQRADVVWGETTVVVDRAQRARHHSVAARRSVAALRLSVRRHGGGVPRSRAADRGRLASALAAVSAASCASRCCSRRARRSRCRASGTSTRAPTGSSASATTCSASRSPAIRTCAGC